MSIIIEGYLYAHTHMCTCVCMCMFLYGVGGWGGWGGVECTEKLLFLEELNYKSIAILLALAQALNECLLGDEATVLAGQE